jgi:AcrR family transcriptional regulator
MTLMTSNPASDVSLAGADPSGVDAALVAAAWQVLERSGYRSLKIRQILDASQSSASAFYRRFPSKAHLLLTLMRAESEQSVRTISAQLRGIDDPRDQLSRWLRFHVSILFDSRRRARALMFSEPDFVTALPAAIREDQTRHYDLLVGIARRGARSGVFATADPDGDADAVYRLIRGLVYDPLTAKPVEAPEVVHGRTEQHALRLLHAKPRDEGNA